MNESLRHNPKFKPIRPRTTTSSWSGGLQAGLIVMALRHQKTGVFRFGCRAIRLDNTRGKPYLVFHPGDFPPRPGVVEPLIETQWERLRRFDQAVWKKPIEAAVRAMFYHRTSPTVITDRISHGPEESAKSNRCPSHPTQQCD